MGSWEARGAEGLFCRLEGTRSHPFLQAPSTACLGQHVLSSVLGAGASSGPSNPFPRFWGVLQLHPSLEIASPRGQPVLVAEDCLMEEGDCEGLVPLASIQDNSERQPCLQCSPGITRGLSGHSVTCCKVAHFSLCPTHPSSLPFRCISRDHSAKVFFVGLSILQCREPSLSHPLI